MPKLSAITEPLIEPKEEDIDWYNLEFPKFLFEPDQPRKTRGKKKVHPKQLKLSTPKSVKKVIDQNEYMQLMEIEEASKPRVK